MKSTIRSLSEVESSQRWDFGYHDPDYLAVMKSLDRCYPVSRLGDIITLLTDMGAFSLYKTEFFVDGGVPFLRVQNIQEYGVDLTRDTKYISVEYHEQLKKSQLHPGDLLLTTKAVIGVAAVVDEHLGECNISQNLVRIRLKDGINPHYVAVLLNTKLGRIQTETAATGPNQKYLNFERIQDLKITLPPQPIQDRIAQVMQDAYDAQREKLAEIDKLFADVDEFVLTQIGLPFIVLPDEKQFTVNINKIFGGRFDLSIYNTQYSSLIFALESTFGSNLKTLASISYPITSGATPLGSTYVREGIPFLRVQNINAYGEIDFNGCLFVSEKFAKTISRSAVKDGDVLLVIVGATIGKCAVARGINSLTVINQALACIKLREDVAVEPDFLKAFLSSQAGQIQIAALKRPVAQGNLSLTETGQILIPIVPPEVQQVITKEMECRRFQAKCLRAEAETLVKEAKARVERMILGEEEVA